MLGDAERGLGGTTEAVLPAGELLLVPRTAYEAPREQADLGWHPHENWSAPAREGEGEAWRGMTTSCSRQSSITRASISMSSSVTSN
jgi:hypothetical protein